MTTVLLLLMLVLAASRLMPAPASLQAHPSSPTLPDNSYRMIRPDGSTVLVNVDDLGPDHRAELEQAMAIVRRIAETQGKPEPHG